MIRSAFILSVCLLVSLPECFSQAIDNPRAQAHAIKTQWPQAVAFISKDCSLKSNGLSIFRIGNTRAYFQFDLPMPSKIGRQLHIIKPARPGVEPRLLLDLGQGCIGSPSASLDGKAIYASMAREGEFFYHIYKIPADGGKPARITDGPFHDLDPAELPDGRIVFSSTRIGTFEEYHSSPSRALFVMNGDGSDIGPITFTSIFDNEPKVMADGSIVFIRSDNFMERAKVETRLHAIRPDGTGGRSIASADRGARYGARLRKFGFGSPAPDTVWVGMLQEDNTPCYRAAAAYALGRIGKRSATDVLMKILGNMDNALDVRHASAIALRRIADDSKAQAIARLAADYPDVSVKQVLLSMSRRD